MRRGGEEEEGGEQGREITIGKQGNTAALCMEKCRAKIIIEWMFKIARLIPGGCNRGE